MKAASLIFLLVSSCILVSCGDDQIQLPEQQLEGTIEGIPWEIKYANAYIYSSDLKYQIRFLSTREGAEDPCSVPSTANTHVSLIMRLTQSGSFSIPLAIPAESARFHFSNGSTAIATSGFLEIFAMNSTTMFGYLQAHLDDDNSVEGSFEVTICQ